MNHAADIPFSIALPVHNRTRYLAEALGSCLNQNYKAEEIIIVDDSDDDHVAAIVRSFSHPSIRYLRRHDHIGLAQKLNLTLEEARGKWMVVLCDDDRFEPGYLAVLAALVRSHREATLVRCRSRIIDSEGRLLRLDHDTEPTLSTADFLNRLFLPESEFFKMNMTGIAFPVVVMKEIGGFKDYHRAWNADRMAWADLVAQGLYVSSSEPLCSIRIHTAAVTGSIDAEYGCAIESTQRFHSDMQRLMERLVARPLSNADQAELRSAQVRLRKHIQRHLSLAVDHGLMHCVRQKEDVRSCLQKVLAQRAELGVPRSTSETIYRCTARLPYRLRYLLMGWLQRHKFMKWHAYAAKS